MAYYITIDGGTTNTRLYLFENVRLLGSAKLPCGASNGKEALSAAVRDGIASLCTAHNIDLQAVSRIVASGMIGSELGLCDAARVTVPATLSALRSKLVTVTLPEVCAVPITFIPGLLQTGDSLDDGDLIRGEETEAIGLLAQMPCEGDVALLLPGTHNKLMLLDADGTVKAFHTAMSGDLVRAAAEHTILSASLEGGYSKQTDADAVLCGYDLAERLGLTAALFKLRVADKQRGTDAKTLYGMLLGMVLHEDVALIGKVFGGSRVLIAGSEPFKTSLHALLCARTRFDAETVPDDMAEASVPLGALKIAGIG